MITIVFLVASFVLFILATVLSFLKTDPPNKVINLIAAGLACWVAAQLFGPMWK